MMKLFRNEEGQTLVLTALLMCILMGFMALSIDMGVSFRTQRRVQSQADAAAIAAALCGSYAGQYCTQYSKDSSGAALTPAAADATSVAARAAKANGMPAGATFTVKPSPTYGQHSNSGYYEVIIKQPSSAPFVGTFAGLFNGGKSAPNYDPMTVGARAVAGRVPGTTCLYVLNKTAEKALYVKGGGGGSKAPATISAPGCSIQVNSNASDALCTTGNSATIDAPQIFVVGAQDPAGKCNNVQNNVSTGVGQANDPFAGMASPSAGCGTGFGLATSFAGSTIKNPTITAYSGGTVTIQGLVNGVSKTISTTGTAYTPVSGGASVSRFCFSDTNLQLGTSSSGGFTLGSSGNEMFSFLHGVAIGGNNSLITVNGTIDIAGGDFQESNVNLFIKGPTADATLQPYSGFALISESTATTCSSSVGSMGTVPAGDGCLQLQFGSNSATGTTVACAAGSGLPGMIGTVYAPHDVLYMQDSGGCVAVTNLVADEVWDNSALTITNYNLAYTTSPLDVVRLVE